MIDPVQKAKFCMDQRTTAEVTERRQPDLVLIDTDDLHDLVGIFIDFRDNLKSD
jgi:hypothetical protein